MNRQLLFIYAPLPGLIHQPFPDGRWCRAYQTDLVGVPHATPAESVSGFYDDQRPGLADDDGGAPEGEPLPGRRATAERVRPLIVHERHGRYRMRVINHVHIFLDDPTPAAHVPDVAWQQQSQRSVNAA